MRRFGSPNEIWMWDQHYLFLWLDFCWGDSKCWDKLKSNLGDGLNCLSNTDSMGFVVRSPPPPTADACFGRAKRWAIFTSNVWGLHSQFRRAVAGTWQWISGVRWPHDGVTLVATGLNLERFHMLSSLSRFFIFLHASYKEAIIGVISNFKFLTWFKEIQIYKKKNKFLLLLLVKNLILLLEKLMIFLPFKIFFIFLKINFYL